MKQTMTTALTRLRDLVAQLTAAQKATMFVAAAAVAALLWSFSTMQATTKPDGSILFAGLAPEVAADITTALDEQAVTYQLGDGGRTIYVPSEQVYPLRVQLAGMGLPDSGPDGYDLLQAEGITTSEFRQRVDYQRALEGELSRTIAAFSAVDSAIVRLALPDDNAFVTGQTETTASVLLDTATPVDEGTVTAIMHLVANAVPDLQREGVTISDATGALLSADGQATGSGGSNDEREQAIGAALAAGAEQLLTAAFGPGNARVTVRAELDFSTVDRTSETYGTDGVVASESLETELYDGQSAAGPADILGELLNDPAGVDGPDDGLEGGELENIDYERDTADRNYAVDRVTEQVSNNGGTIDRLTVAVLVNDTLDVEPAAIQAVVANAVGVNADRGDDIEVVAVPFAATDVEEDPEVEVDNSDLIRLIAVAAVVAISLIVAAVMLLAGRRRNDDDTDDDTLVAAGTVGPPAGLDVVIDDDIGDDDSDDIPGDGGEEVDVDGVGSSLDLAEALQVSGDADSGFDPPPAKTIPPAVEQMVEEDPTRIAELLKIWLEER